MSTLMTLTVYAIVLLGGPLLAVVAIVRTLGTARIKKHLAQLEARIADLEAQRTPEGLLPPQGVETPSRPVAPVIAPPIGQPGKAVTAGPVPAGQAASFSLEMLIGQKALGWAAVVVLLFATAFFLRYAFENNWLGPLGRVALGQLGGIALAVGGWRFWRRGGTVFGQMLSAAGVTLMYLTTFAAFGFYHLLSQQWAGLFLAVIAVETALLSLAYRAPALAIMSIVGGLLTPLLMHSEHDAYVSLFLYLLILNAGAVLLVVLRPWGTVTSLAMLGSQMLFWMWHAESYHPEKLWWALGFQGSLYGLHLIGTLVTHAVRLRRANWQDILRILCGPALAFLAAYVLLREDYRHWLGALAVANAAVYVALARVFLSGRRPETQMFVAAVAVATGFIALAIPLEAEARWIAVGWAAMAATLLWFGFRINALSLRGFAAVIAALALLRIVIVDSESHVSRADAPWLLLNDYLIPSSLALACLLGAGAASRRFVARALSSERVLAGLGVLSLLFVVGLTLSVDWWVFCGGQRMISPDDSSLWRWTAQLGLSVLWGLYASILLGLGFALRQSLFRWTALGLFALTSLKVFLIDMHNLDELYRILAFFALAVALGLAAWAYQKKRLVLSHEASS